ncbi:hypothetical protein L208DRAFT_1552211, partial [Tricholoma matsutake]
MTSSMLVLPSRLPRCLARCTKPFLWFYLQLNTTEVILYNKPSSLHLIIAFDSNFKESTTSPQRHPFKHSQCW